MSYGRGRFSNLDLPDPGLTYVARKAFKHHDLTFQPGDLVTAEQIGRRHLVKYVRTRLVQLPDAEPGAGARDAAPGPADELDAMDKPALMALAAEREIRLDRRLGAIAMREALRKALVDAAAEPKAD